MAASIVPKTVTAAEVAFMAGLTDREINRLVDENVLSAPLVQRDDGRRFAPLTACFADFYFSMSESLTRSARIGIIDTLTQRLLVRPDLDAFLTLSDSVLRGNFDWSVHLDVLTVALTRYVEVASQRAGRVSEAAQHVTEDPQILGGMPCFAGTRVPVASVLAAKQQGMALDELHAAWPFLTAELLDHAEVYMKAHPRPGRPRRLDEDASRMKLVSRKVVRHPREHA
ncbi:DUF433 domain-containing protein [Burkholderia guangdongensis]|uniref:DUF433 domain-containing protein n=1 Tax=Burkholderia guangdongensis TaxID=1792500 RepID=UPI0015C6F4C9|nr:DUF433 domain-containing protein [Burkholderia guangdongensis]